MSNATFDPRLHNKSGNEPFSAILEKSMSRRSILRGGLGMASATMLGSMLAACGSNDIDNTSTVASDRAESVVPPGNLSSVTLGFDSIPGSLTDAVVVPAGYIAQTLAPWGDPLKDNGCAWLADGTNTSEELSHAIGMHHDGIYYFPVDGNAQDGILVINHEYIDQNALHPDGPTRDEATGKRNVVDEIRKEIISHGVSVVRVKRDPAGQWRVVLDDPLNRRYTGGSEMKVSGPVAGCGLLVTKFSPDGARVRGTLNNCGNGYTPWGTYLTCEENWPGYFVNKGEQTADQIRIGIEDEGTRYGWEDLAGDATEVDDEFARFDSTPGENSAAFDYRNEPNGHGYIVEIDPYTAESIAVKRSALGRFRHEGCVPGRLVAGEPVVFYSGHDGRGEYIYKFVSAASWDPADLDPADRLATGAKYMDNGTLYVARFNEDGTGTWEPLTTSNPALAQFNTQYQIIINTVVAADLVGATPMDRPEWGAVDPETGAVYFTLTNNTRRGTDGSVSAADPNSRNPADAANPRAENANGHIIRWIESDNPTAFNWDIFVFGSYADAPADVNISGLQALNQFASPDGLAFDKRGILWIQTDNGAAEVAGYTNDQMLAVVPSQLTNADGSLATITSENQVELRRFFVGPNGCEVTGVTFTPDNKTCFVNIQHPGNWPYSSNAAQETPEGVTLRPRAATVAISRADGGEIGVA
ncbi:MAG: PhoX family phosphatase [Burkholderiaceae bacterium]